MKPDQSIPSRKFPPSGFVLVVVLCFLSLVFASATLGDDAPQSVSRKRDPVHLGLSLHGPAFDEGPRQKPWRIERIGNAHFPITVPKKEVHDEVQMWFDQGNALLHSYWFFEAERAFRWCIKLDPNCAMAYWALYRCAPVISTTGTLVDVDENRPKDFLKEASRRKHLVTDRERMYIEAWEVRPSAQASVGYSVDTLTNANQLLFKQRLEQILLKYPDDLEAKALYVTENLFSYSVGPESAVNRYGNELILQQILAQQPDHPGAHHIRIHNWDGPDGWVALDSMDRYGMIAPGVGHALHMPGHGYSGQGMWHEAAIAMDSATRVEQQYMREHKILPYHELWNYAHNRDYLCFFQEQLGMADAAVDGARQLIATPLDPKFNNPTNAGVTYREGLAALRRALVKFERWEEILRPGASRGQRAWTIGSGSLRRSAGPSRQRKSHQLKHGGSVEVSRVGSREEGERDVHGTLSVSVLELEVSWLWRTGRTKTA